MLCQSSDLRRLLLVSAQPHAADAAALTYPCYAAYHMLANETRIVREGWYERNFFWGDGAPLEGCSLLSIKIGRAGLLVTVNLFGDCYGVRLSRRLIRDGLRAREAAARAERGVVVAEDLQGDVNARHNREGATERTNEIGSMIAARQPKSVFAHW